MNKPLISIIVPIYNQEKYLDRCIKSIVSQTYNEIEVVLVDDGSNDKSASICDNWQDEDSRFKVIHKENEGAFASRLAGVNISNGEYITFVDSDDWLSNDTIEYLYKILVDYGVSISSVNCKYVDNENIIVDNTNEVVQVLDFSDIIIKLTQGEGLCYQCGKLYKKELFLNLPELPSSLTVSEDMMLNYFLYKNSNVAFSNQEKYYYFRHSGSIMQSCISDRMIDDSMTAYNVIDIDFDKSNPVYPYQLYNKILSDFFLLNSIIRNNCCLNRYSEIKEDIINSYSKIQNKSILSKKHQLAIMLLKISSAIYNLSIKFRARIRGY